MGGGRFAGVMRGALGQAKGDAAARVRAPGHLVSVAHRRIVIGMRAAIAVSAARGGRDGAGRGWPTPAGAHLAAHMGQVEEQPGGDAAEAEAAKGADKE